MARILIVEDEAHIVRVLSMWLGRHGHEILDAPQGAAALDILDREPIDLIISDMNMPVMDGLGLARAVRESRGLHTPFFLLTARCDRAKLTKLLEPFDVTLYPKPFVPSRLVADVERVLGLCVSQGNQKP